MSDEASLTDAGWTDGLDRFAESATGAGFFMDLASQRHALRQLSRHMNLGGALVLEFGTSSGRMFRALRAQTSDVCVVGSDVLHTALGRLAARSPGLPLAQLDAERCGVKTNSVDAVVLLNVLEHLSDDVQAMSELFRILKPEGVLVLEVPAGPHLFDAYDRLLRHRRRYSQNGLRTLAEGVGFAIVERSHLGFLLYPGFWLAKRRNQLTLGARRLPADEVRRSMSTQIGRARRIPLIGPLMEIETSLGRWLQYPIGIRCLVTFRKPAG